MAYGPYTDWVNERGITAEERRYRKEFAKDQLAQDRRAGIKDDERDIAKMKRLRAAQQRKEERERERRRKERERERDNSPQDFSGSDTKFKRSPGEQAASFGKWYLGGGVLNNIWNMISGGKTTIIDKIFNKTSGNRITESRAKEILDQTGMTWSEFNDFISKYPDATEADLKDYMIAATKLAASGKLTKNGKPASENDIFEDVLNSPAQGDDSPNKFTNAFNRLDKNITDSIDVKDSKKIYQAPVDEDGNIDPDDLPAGVKSNKLSSELLSAARENLHEAKKERQEFKKMGLEQYDTAQDDRKRQMEIEDETRKKFEQRVIELRAERNRSLQNYEIARRQSMLDRDDRRSLMNEIKNAPSTYEEAQRQGHEKALQNASALASVLPTSQGGGVVSQLMNQARQQDLDVASASAVGRLQEAEGRRKQLGDLIAQNQEAAQKQQGIDQGLMSQALAAMQAEAGNAALPLSIAGRAQSSYLTNQAQALDTFKTGMASLMGAAGMGSGAIGSNLDIRKYLSSEDQRTFDNMMAKYQLGLQGLQTFSNAAGQTTGAMAKAGAGG